MRDSELAPVVEALQRHVGLPFAGAWQPARDRFILGLGRDTYLLMVPRGPLARLHSLADRPANPRRPFSFQGAVRAHLGGALTAIDKVHRDRVVDFHFGPLRLHLRLTGRGGGLWLLDDEDDVIAAYDGPAPEALPILPDLPPRSRPRRFEPAESEDWDRAARRWFDERERNRRLDRRRTQVRKRLQRKYDRDRRLLENLEQDLERSFEAPEVRAQADTLAAHLHEIERGTDEIALPDVADPERTHHIHLDPGKPASAAMERLYKRAGRLERAGERVMEQMAGTEESVERLRTALDRVEDADHAVLDELEQLAPSPSTRRGGRDEPTPWNTWVGPDGQEIWVGRNEKSNRKLTFQKAHGNDFWMHLRDRPGAHVVIPMRSNKTPPKELLLAAARITLVEAGLREGATADVQYTRVKHVRAIPGEVARVRVAEEKVLHVRREAGALVGWNRE